MKLKSLSDLIDLHNMFSRKEGVVGYKKRYSDFSPTLEEQGMLLAMGKRGEQLFEENGGYL